MQSKTLIVFDMDGVIIDVSGSYRDTVRQSARLFFKGAAGWENLPDPLFPLTDLARVKQSGGLNNDWDLTFVVINLLFTLVKGGIDPQKPDAGLGYQHTISRCNVGELAQFLDAARNPLTTLLKKTGKQNHKFITSLYTGDVGSGNIIKQIFQEIYLGKDLFESTYGIPAKFYLQEGYINREKLLIDSAFLHGLAEKHTLAIATGRPRAEADYPLDVFNLRPYFGAVYSLDDCLEEERNIFEREKKEVNLSKPNPFMLDAIYESQRHEISICYYIGDMPDDMVAAKRSKAGFFGVGILISSDDKENLKKDLQRAGADYIVEDFEELKQIIHQVSGFGEKINCLPPVHRNLKPKGL